MSISHNILVTAIGGDIGQGVFRSLRLYSPNLYIVGTDIDAVAPGLYMCDTSYIIRPAAGENADFFIDKLVEICNNEHIDIAFICHETEQRVISQHIDYLKQHTKTFFVVQSQAVLSITTDKQKTYTTLKDKGIRVPETYVDIQGIDSLIKKYSFPLVIKPRQSCGSRGFNIVKNKIELEKIWSAMNGGLIQEYISNSRDEEYTVGIFLDNNGKSLGAIPMRRQLREGLGMTWYAFADDYPEIESVAIKAAEAVGAVGPCNVQLRPDRENNPCVIEINARISGTTVFRAKLGYNEAGASIDYFLHNRLPNLKYRRGYAMKIWDELIIPIETYEAAKEQKIIHNTKKA